MKKRLVTAFMAVAMLAGTAFAERFVMITHTQGTDPFWPVVQKGVKMRQEPSVRDLITCMPPQGTCPIWRS